MRRIGLALLLALLVSLSMAAPCLAQANPDTPPTITSVKAYRNLLVAGDELIIIHAVIPYAAIPTIPCNQAFVWTLIAGDGVTILGSTTGYPYNVGAYAGNGYNHAIWSFYLASGLTWGALYGLKLSGLPTTFTTPPVYNFSLNYSDYSLMTTSDENKAELASDILTLAGNLDLAWGLSTDYSLIESTEGKTALSAYGATYFRGVITGVQNMAPDAFSQTLVNINIVARTWTTSYSANLTTQWIGTWVETAIEGNKALFHTSYDLFAIVMVLLMCGAAMFATISISQNPYEGLLDAAFVAVIAARLGLYGLGYLALICFICVIILGAKLRERIWGYG